MIVRKQHYLDFVLGGKPSVTYTCTVVHTCTCTTEKVMSFDVSGKPSSIYMYIQVYGKNKFHRRLFYNISGKPSSYGKTDKNLQDLT